MSQDFFEIRLKEKFSVATEKKMSSQKRKNTTESETTKKLRVTIDTKAECSSNEINSNTLLNLDPNLIQLQAQPPFSLMIQMLLPQSQTPVTIRTTHKR
ncbi:hypothetical protein Glove_26g257 [Diversispora epigaea]|uniref:Uncharacterized protein n=1 Tax=Diversispora epigaea TaxID=1348612 RepID=A0A397JKL4_9GLOM|nr:hypothetical protein Glove_26g257 [Diversispora epigaea]